MRFDFRFNTNHHSRFFVFLLLSLTLISNSLMAGPSGETREFDPYKDVKVEAFLSHDGLNPDLNVKLAVVYHLAEGYHITDLKYGMFYVEADTLDQLSLGNLSFPVGEDEGVGEEIEKVYRGDVTVYGDLQIKSGNMDSADWKIYVGYQICRETGDLMCYMPVDKEIELKVNFVESASLANSINPEVFGDPSTAEISMSADESLEGRLMSALESGNWVLSFFVLFIAGVLSSLTPCVYPVIPITISFIGARSKGRLHGFIQSIYFVIGLALIYSMLGVAAAAFGGSFGAVGQSAGVQIFIAIIFLIFAASMFGAFEIQLPSSISAKLQQGDKSSPLGAIMMGAVTGFIAAPCVGPVIAALLVFIAGTQSLFIGFFLMLAYALGMGMLFLLIGTFAGALNALPGAGGWMETVKKFFGVVMVAMAIYFLRAFINVTQMTWLAGGGLIIFAVFSGAFTQINEESSTADKFYKAVGLIALVLGAKFLFFGMGSAVVGGAVQPVLEKVELQWSISSPDNNQHEKILAEAVIAGKPVIVDFWAEWCAQCKELDHKTWSDPVVFEEGQRFTRIKMDMTQSESAWALAQNESYSVVGMPTVIFYNSSGQEVKRFIGFQKPDKVLDIMQSVR
jgi:thioredoxin:protein disulfide reductase